MAVGKLQDSLVRLRGVLLNSVTVLLSGGIDSTALLHYYKVLNTPVNALYIDYGQSVAYREAQSSRIVASHYNIDLRIVQIDPPLKHRGYEILCRNAVLVLVACANLPLDSSRVSLGIHSGTTYYDCSKKFVEDIQRLLDGYFSGTVTLEAPFLNWTKWDIYRYCWDNAIPLDLTYSCERHNDKPCSQCPSCLDRRRLCEIKRSMSRKTDQHY